MAGFLSVIPGLGATRPGTDPGRKGYKIGSTATMQWIRLVLVLCYAVHSTGNDCQPSDVLTEAGGCMSPLSGPTMAALHGELKAKDWTTTCGTYNQSRLCVEKLIKNCPTMASEVRESVTQALKTSMGQLCESRQAFQRYLGYAECYASQKNRSMFCMAQFQREAEAVEPDSESFHEELCSIHAELIQCTKRDIQSRCGADAAQLIHGITKAQLPLPITKNCPRTEPPSSAMPHMYGSHAHCSATTWLTAWAAIVLTLL